MKYKILFRAKSQSTLNTISIASLLSESISIISLSDTIADPEQSHIGFIDATKTDLLPEIFVSVLVKENKAYLFNSIAHKSIKITDRKGKTTNF